MRAYSRTPPDARFDAKVDRSSASPCWLWTAAVADTGYGVFNRGGGQLVAAHRYAYERAKGEIPAGAVVMHTCDVRRCCNPEHLVVGSIAENNDDMARKGRARNAPRRGEQHHAAKLTAAQVAEARAEWGNRGKTGRSAGGITIAQLAARYGVSTTAMHSALTGETWT